MTEVYYDLFRIVDWSNSSGKTPLHYAAQVDNAPFIDLF
jgi:ankyrin repeat protein